MRRGFLIALTIVLSGCRSSAPRSVARFAAELDRTYEEALLGDLAVATRHARVAAEEWGALRRVLDADGVSTCELAAVDERVAGMEEAATAKSHESPHDDEPREPSTSERRRAAVDSRALARAANAASAEAADMMRRYRALVPARLLELEVLGREIILDADAAEWRAADAAFAALGREWARLRPCASAADPAGTSGFDACMSQLSRPLEERSSPSVVLATNNCLEQVKLLRKVLVP